MPTNTELGVLRLALVRGGESKSGPRYAPIRKMINCQHECRSINVMNALFFIFAESWTGSNLGAKLPD